MSSSIINLLLQESGETFYMVIVSTAIAYLFGYHLEY